MVTAGEQACLIGLDWGSTSLRAWLIGPDGAVLEERKADKGASTLDGHAAFVAAFDEVTLAWRAACPGLPVLACGMVGSSHGWLDVPYVRCAAGQAELAAAMARVPDGPSIVPGLLYDAPGLPPDLMRGEETQILGALHAEPGLEGASCIVLPGTHSKWAQVANGQVRRFSTYMTGELYALLRQHSVLGRLIPAEPAEDQGAFLEGVDAAYQHGEQGLSHQLFAVRTLGVTQRMPAGALADYLSGLLIGHEIRSGLAWRAQAGLLERPLVLVGEPRLCARYAYALAHVRAPAARVLDNVAPAGLLAVARAAGLVPV
jgi:2-dehydro-3-deoxygalactonokinase